MADVTFNGVAIAIGVQTGFGTPNGTIAALDETGTPDLSDGHVLGDAESGDAESGVTIPNIVGVYRAVPAVASSFTEGADQFEKAEVNGLAFSWIMQGNGAAPAGVGTADLATIIPGLEAILESSGLEGAAGGAGDEQDYTTRADTIYSTIKMWHGDLAFVYSDCVVETLTFEPVPGGKCLATASFAVGTFNHLTEVDGETFPTIDYEEMSDLAGPTVEGVAFAAFGVTRDFENLTVTITNTLESFNASNVTTTGQRLLQTKRVISVTGRLYVDSVGVASKAAFTELKNLNAPTNDLSFQVGTASDAGGLNAFKVEVFNLQPKDIKYDETGSLFVVDLNDSKATSLTAGTEFQLTMN